MKARWVELMVTIKAERRKAGMLGALLLVLAVLGVRTFVDGPTRSARAASDDAAVSRGGSLSSASLALNFDKLRAQGPITRVPAPTRLDRNLFIPDVEFFPGPSPPALPASPVQTEPPASAGPKSEPGNDEESEVSVDPAERIAKEAEGLRLKSTLVGNAPLAVLEILGRRGGQSPDERRIVLRPGQTIDGFVLVEVRTQSVLIEKEGVQIELKRALPER